MPNWQKANGKHHRTRAVASKRMPNRGGDETQRNERRRSGSRGQEGEPLQYPTERTLTRISKACNKRIDAVRSREIVEIVAEGLPDAAAQANLYMMMCAYPLVRHFMLDEIARRFAELDYSFPQPI